MTRPGRSVCVCQGCGHEQWQWTGRCAACGAWGSIEQRPATPRASHGAATTGEPALPILDVPLDTVRRRLTRLAELDRVLGGGVVPGSVILLGGEPGVGKSTLLLQAAQALATDATVLYVSAEESAAQVRLRAERLGALTGRLLVAAESTLPAVVALVDDHRPDVLIVDSIQTVIDPARDSSAGSVVQVRECAAALVRVAKARDLATILVGHVTKDGALAGPRVLEHLVDVVLAFEGDHHHALRLLRAVKNRFGRSGDVGCFEMADRGLREVPDPGALFLASHDQPVPGVAVTVAVEGPRPLTVEVQALAARSSLAMPRRQVSGLDPARVALLTAVVQRHTGVDVRSHDLFASAVGGVRLREPAADLAVCLAIASSRNDRPLHGGSVAVGEVGLAGEVRVVGRLSQRLAEGARLGFARALVPLAYDGPGHGLTLERVGDIATAVRVAMAGAVPAVR